MKETQANANSDILRIALRIGAVVIAVNAIEKFPGFYATYDMHGEFDWYLFAGFLVLPTLVAFLVSALMWFSPPVFLKSFQTGTEPESQPATSSEIGRVLVSAIGLYILSFSVGDLIYHITYIKTIGVGHLEYMPETVAGLVATFAEIVIGIALIFGNNVISRLITRFHNEKK